MREDSRTIQLEGGLAGLGLTKYEARAYVSLLLCNDATAEELSRASGISPSRIYDTLSSLSHESMVTVVNTKPKRYHAVDAESAVGSLVSRREAELGRRMEELKRMEKAMVKAARGLPRNGGQREGGDFIGMLRGKESLEKWIRGMLRNAKSEVLIFGGDLDWSHHDLDRMKMLRKRGAAVKILADVNGRNRGLVEEARRSGIEVRKKPRDVDLRGFIFDRGHVYISNRIASPQPGSKDYGALITNSKPLAKSLRDYFMLIWSSSA